MREAEYDTVTAHTKPGTAVRSPCHDTHVNAEMRVSPGCERDAHSCVDSK